MAPAAADRLGVCDLLQCARIPALPERDGHGGWRVALAEGEPRPGAEWFRAVLGAGPVAIETWPRQGVIDTFLERHGAVLTAEAVNGLKIMRPNASARHRVTRVQGIAALALLGLAIWSLIEQPFETARVAVIALSTLYVIVGLFRVILFWIGSEERARGVQPDAGTTELASITVLVPLYREAHMVGQIVEALRALDYPPRALDIKLVLEADDAATVAAVEELALDARFEIIRVPASHPRMKPKALNVALAFARGEIVSVYDAEDRPDPQQLRSVAAAFASGGRRLAAVQARLLPDNSRAAWLSRLFALEYALWFDYLLPGLARLKLPIPLGGTSNHLRADILRKVGGWDAFNVTEDADLGLRLACAGYRIDTIDSITWEEAPETYRAWSGQRGRWMKGYFQTWLVIARQNLRLLWGAGLGGFLSTHLFLGGTILAALINPILWIGFALSLAFGPKAIMPDLGSPAVELALASFLVGNVLYLFLLMLAGQRPQFAGLAPVALTAFVYWVLVSVAAYQGLADLIRQPHHWRKTEHRGRAAPHVGGDET